MMLIIADKSPYKSVDWLIENTNKNFCWKQLLELGQLICSAGISDVFKPIKQGKEIQKWIKNNSGWVLSYYSRLLVWCVIHKKIKEKTFDKFREIMCNLYDFCEVKELNGIKYISRDIKTAVFRYVKKYSEFTKYPTNSELPIEMVTELYKKYITEFKFKKSEVTNV